MKRVLLESPYAGTGNWLDRIVSRWLNIRYARRCVRDSLTRGEAPIALHLLYPQPGILDDGDPVERELGIAAGLEWRFAANASVVYVDRGISLGMDRGIAAAKRAGLKIEYRQLDGAPQSDAVDARDLGVGA